MKKFYNLRPGIVFDLCWAIEGQHYIVSNESFMILVGAMGYQRTLLVLVWLLKDKIFTTYLGYVQDIESK